MVFRRTEKERFGIERALGPIREAVRRLPKSAAYAHADEVFDSRFEQLVACIVSIRTEDEVSKPVARSLLDLSNAPERVCRMTPEMISQLIDHSAYH